MPRWIAHEVFAEGVRIFSERAGATFSRPDELAYQITFPAGYEVMVGIEGFGMAMSFSAYCGTVPDPSFAPTFLQQNWGGVESSCLYFSVHVDDGQPLLFLETRQFLDPSTTSDDIASILGRWSIQLTKVKETLGW